MSITMAKTDQLIDAMKAILIWRDLESTSENINKINKSELECNLRAFPKFAILRNKKNIDAYRKAYTKKTNKDWREATINDIFKAGLVW